MSAPPALPFTPAQHRAAITFVGATVPLLALYCIIFFARLSPRIRPSWAFGWDDGFVIIAFIAATGQWASNMAGTAWALGNPPALTLHQLTETLKLLYIGAALFICASGLVKISIVFTLMRFMRGWQWRVFLYLMIFVQAVYMVGNLVFLFGVYCRPLAAAWNGDYKRCLSPQTFIVVASSATFINIATEIILSITPAAFLRNLQRPLLEKVMLCSLMAVGLLTSTVSIKKYLLVRALNSSNQGELGHVFRIQLLGCSEIFLSVIAACMPCLKSAITDLFGISFKFRVTLPSLQTSHARIPGEEQPVASQRKRSLREKLSDFFTISFRSKSSRTQSQPGRHPLDSLSTGGKKDESLSSSMDKV